MDEYPPGDPTSLLLNEIDILLAQTRLMELYIKQAQLASTAEAARLEEKHRSERAALRQALAEKEQTLAARERSAAEKERELCERIRTLEQDMGALRRLEERDAQWNQNVAEAAALRHRIAQLEAEKQENEAAARIETRARTELQSALAALRQELEDSRRDLQRQEIVSKTLQENLYGQLELLRGQLAQREAPTAQSELENARRELAEWRRRVEELQAGRSEFEAAAARELEQARARFDAELAGLKSALDERDRGLRQVQSVMDDVERRLRQEAEALRFQLGEKQRELAARNEELGGVQGQLAALRARVAELEAAQQQTAARAAEAEDARALYEGEVESLRREVALREQALAERQEAVSAVELALHGKIQSLHLELARYRSALEAREQEARQAHAEAQSLRDERSKLEGDCATHLSARLAAEETCRSLRAELAGLQRALAQSEALAEERELAARSLEDQLRGEIQALCGQLEEQRRGLETAKNQTEEARREIEKRREEAEAARQQWAADWSAKEAELRAALAEASEQKETALKAQESSFKAKGEELNGEIARLQGKLQQQQAERALLQQEVEHYQAELASLREEKILKETSYNELERSWRQSTELRQEVEKRIGALERALRAAQEQAGRDKEAALKEQASRFREAEARFADELARLGEERELERRAAEQARRELSELRPQASILREHSAQWEIARRELENKWRQAASLHQELEARLQAKETELNDWNARFEEEKTGLLRQQEERLLAREAELGSEIERLRFELARQQRNFEQGSVEISQLRAEAALVQEARAQAEEQRRQAEQNAHELAALRRDFEARLRAKEEALREAQADAEAAKNESAAKLHEMQMQLAHSRLLADSRSAEVDKLKTDLIELAGRFDSERAAAQAAHDAEVAAETLLAEARAQWEREADSLRQELQQKDWAVAQLQASAEDLALARRSEVQKLEQKLADQERSFLERSQQAAGAQSYTRSLERRIAELEQELRAEVDRWVREAQEKSQLLQNRNEELVAAKRERDRLQQSYEELATASARGEAAVSAEMERMRAEFQAQLALLQADLSQKEWALEEQRAAASGMDQKYREEINSLRRQVEHGQGQHSTDSFVMGDEALNEEPNERYHKLRQVVDEVATSSDPSFPASENRRWRNRFAWKRRWR